MGIAERRKYTNKHFKDNFVDLASNEPKIGHLTNKKKDKGSQNVSGILKYIIINRVESNGWIVEVGSGSDKTTYSCTNPQWALTMPDSNTTDKKYVPKHKTRVEISIDKKHKIYTIQRVINSKSAISNYQDMLKISIDQDEKTNSNVNAEIKITADEIELGANSVNLKANNQKIDLIKQSNQIQVLINDNLLLKEKINNIEKKLNNGAT